MINVHSQRFRITGTIFVLVTAIVVFLVWSLIVAHQSGHEQRVLDREQSFLDLIAVLCRAPLVNNEFDALQQFAGRSVNDAFVDRFLLADAGNRIVVGEPRGELLQPATLPGRTWRFISVSGNAGILGTAAVRFKREELTAVSRSMWNRTLLLSPIVLLITAAVSWLLGSLLSRRFELLSDAARQIAAGDLDIRIDTAGSDEISGVAQALNTMTASLRETMEAYRQEQIHLANERTRLQTLLQTIPDLIWLKDPGGVYLSCNTRFEQFLAAKEPEIVGKTDYAFFDRELADFFRAHDKMAIAAGTPSVNEEWVTFANDGHRELLETIKTPMRDSAGNLIGVLGIARNITALKQAEENLRLNEQRLRTLFDGAPIGMFRTTLDGRFIQINTAQAAMFGYSTPEEMMGLVNPAGSAAIIWESAESRAAFIERVKDAQGSYIQEEVHLRRRDGSPLDAIFNVMLSSDSGTGEPCLLGFVTDVSERKQLEEQLRQSQKMESIGRLAGGVAHDFNNMLTVILSGVQLAESKLPGGDAVHKYLEMIRKAAERSTTITRQLLAFSRQQVISPRPLNLNALITESHKLLSRLITEDIRLVFRAADDLWPVNIDPSQVDQVLMNLVVNARDAMPDGGNLILETANLTIDDAYCRTHLDARPGSYVQLAVSDTGCGMDHTIMQHIFEPFFTTKKLGEGTGLGLATVYGIVTQNHGFINVYSEPEIGTTFRVYLPRHEQEISEEREVAAAKPAGTGSILLVEDEEMLLWTIAEMLEQMGYAVMKTASPLDAIDICRKGERRIDLILTDVVMPEMNGRELIERIREIQPSVKVLFMSGYSADIVAQRGIVEGGMHYIQKPLDSGSLREKIGEVLAG